MKIYLLAACAAAVLVGCAENRGGMWDRSNQESGRTGSDQIKVYTNSSGTVTNGTLDTSGAPASEDILNTGDGSSSSTPSEQRQDPEASPQGSTSDRSSGATGVDNSQP